MIEDILKQKAQKSTGRSKKTAVTEQPAGLILSGDSIKIIREEKHNKDRSRIVAFISGRIGSTFVTSVVRGTEERVRDFGSGMYELQHYPASGRKNGAGDAVREIIGGKKADAVIILSVMPDAEALKLIRESSIPAVFIERRVLGLHSVTIDNYAGGFSAGMRLIECGCKNPGIILDPQSSEPGMASHERLVGFISALKKARIKADHRNNSTVKYHTIECGRGAFEQVSPRIKKIDGVFSVAGDLAAIGFMIEAKSQGVRVPADLAIIGFDDVEMAAAVEPALTTVCQPINTMGAAAVDIIHEHLTKGLKKHKNIVLESRLIVRGSA